MTLAPPDPMQPSGGVTARNRLKQLMSDPNSYSGTPGFKFALDTGLSALDRQNSTIRNTPNALLDAMKYGTGLAQQDYGGEMSRLIQAAGNEDQFELGQGQNANAATRNANDLALGHESNANTLHGIDTGAETSRYNTDVGAATSRYNTDANTGLGYFKNASDFLLGSESNANTRENNQLNYRLGEGRNANDSAQIFSNYDLGEGRNAIDWYNAGTNRGSAQSNAYNQNQTNALNWYKAKPQSGVYPDGSLWKTSGR